MTDINDNKMMRFWAFSMVFCFLLETAQCSFVNPYLHDRHLERPTILRLGKDVAVDRRSFGIRVCEFLGTVQAVSVLSPFPASAYPQENEDKEKIKKGYERLNYLLDNWVAETTVCGKGDDNPYTGTKGCERTPLIVMDYLGYKSTNDPLFKADKTLKRLAVLVPTEDGPTYLDAMEKWVEAAEEASGMAYVSSWGEANPGGGKDRVELFIERAKKNVIDARDSLDTAIRILAI